MAVFFHFLFNKNHLKKLLTWFTQKKKRKENTIPNKFSHIVKHIVCAQCTHLELNENDGDDDDAKSELYAWKILNKWWQIVTSTDWKLIATWFFFRFSPLRSAFSLVAVDRCRIVMHCCHASITFQFLTIERTFILAINFTRTKKKCSR